MAIVGALDIHRNRSRSTGRSRRGESGRGRSHRRIGSGSASARPVRWQAIELVVEGCTGWRFVAEESRAAVSRCMSRIGRGGRGAAEDAGEDRPDRRAQAA